MATAPRSPYYYGGGTAPTGTVARPVAKPTPRPRPRGAADPYGAVPTVAGLTVAQISRMTPAQLYAYQASVLSRGPDYSGIPSTINFQGLQASAQKQATDRVNEQAAPYQKLRNDLAARAQQSGSAAQAFTQAFTTIAGGGNKNIDDPAAQQYSLEHFGGSYIGGMAASLGTQLAGNLAATFSDQDFKYASQMADILSQRPDLADKIYSNAVNDAITQIKAGRSIADMDQKNKIAAIAAAIKAKQILAGGGTTASETSWQTVNGHRVLVNDITGQVINDAGTAGTPRAPGSTKPTYRTVGGSLYEIDPTTGQPSLLIAGPKKSGKGAGGKTVTASQAQAAMTKAEKAAYGAIDATAQRIWDNTPHSNLGPPSSGADTRTPQQKALYESATREYQRRMDMNFGTAMAKTINAIAPYLKSIGASPAYIKMQAYRLVTTGHVDSSGTLTHFNPPKGYKVPTAKNISYQSGGGLPGSQYATYTRPAPPDSVVYQMYKDSGPMSDQQLVQVLMQAGFQGQGLQVAYSIAKRESGANPLAFNGNAGTGDRSWGLFQINTLGSMTARVKQFGLRSEMQLLDPVTNAKAAYRMSNGGTNFGSWGYGQGAYRQVPLRILPLPGTV